MGIPRWATLLCCLRSPWCLLAFPEPWETRSVLLLHLLPWPATSFQCCGATVIPTIMPKPRLAVSLWWKWGIVFCISKCFQKQIKCSGCARETMTCFICVDKSSTPVAKVQRFPVVMSLWLSLYSKGCWSYLILLVNVHNWKYYFIEDAGAVSKSSI